MPSAKKIAVAGATGRVGHHVTDILTERGYDVVPMSRSAPWPTLTPTVAARLSSSSKRAAGTRRCLAPRDGNVRPGWRRRGPGR